jgi:hypothetical protein
VVSDALGSIAAGYFYRFELFFSGEFHASAFKSALAVANIGAVSSDTESCPEGQLAARPNETHPSDARLNNHVSKMDQHREGPQARIGLRHSWTKRAA